MTAPSGSKMHADEVEIDETLVRRLLGEQLPHWVERPLQRVEPEGTDNAIFRLGDDLAVRLARRRGPTQPGGKLFEWLPVLAPLLPVAIPVPVAQGHPTRDYPWFWEIHTWIEGETVAIEQIDAIQAARDLAALVGALQELSPTDAPIGRGIPLAQRDGSSASGSTASRAIHGWRRSGSVRSRHRRGTGRRSGTTATSTHATGSFAAGGSVPSSTGPRWVSVTRPAT
jgi:aminoglycoside phosphotransferase (APT) family kinase protein